MTESVTLLNGDCQISDNGSFIYPKDKAMTADDLENFVNYHNDTMKPKYLELRKEYLGQHPIFEEPRKGGLRPDNRLMANLTKYVVETFNGYFIGVPPNITLNDEKDNEELQNWIGSNSFADKLSEISRQCDIYGRSIAFVYQDENSNTKVTYTSPETSFMIYDDTVEMNPIAYVRYSFNNSAEVNGTIYFADYQFNFDSSYKLDDSNTLINPFNTVPAVEFSSNVYKQGLINDIKSLNDALDNALSQKANQNEYFDNSYLSITGLELPTDEDGNPQFNLDGNQVFYSPEASAQDADVKFIEKPDGDNMQEHLIDRLTNLIYQISMVSNLNDQAFAGNSSGVALKYKLLPMQNMAVNKERKFTQSMRQLFKTIFSVDTILKNDHVDAWKDLSFKFYQNLPVNVSDEASTARSLEGIVSKETQLGTLSFVDDPKKEIQRMADEHIDEVENAKKAAGNISDQGD
ncbi:phage portal protein [Fructilactobacillus frigidiflavus]|uniref:phage portal protein n=1 Tax=Fructilactobacillus frigidiflavus TaxID=3242688 RepID=UPI0037578E39